MIRKWVMLVVVAGFFAATAIFAGTSVPDVVEMKNPAYEKHTRGIASFTHKKHTETYGIGCGECHHDDSGEPLTDLEYGDEVKNCIECHSIPGQPPRGKDAPKLTEAQKLEYHAEAIHENCRDCHRKYNKEKGLKRKDPGYAPTTCSQCHPKE
ncbi:MAG: cytochrome c3 family protein [Desulfobacterales bacterium]